MTSKCIRLMYSPKMPIPNNSDPEKNTITIINDDQPGVSINHTYLDMMIYTTNIEEINIENAPSPCKNLIGK